MLPEAPEAATQAIERGVDKVVLTGSTETGRKVLASLAPHLTPATMELSGSDAAFVRPDANLQLVVSALAFSLRLNGGATCIASRQVFVYPALAPTLERRLADRVGDLGPFNVEPSAFERPGSWCSRRVRAVLAWCVADLKTMTACGLSSLPM